MKKHQQSIHPKVRASIEESTLISVSIEDDNTPLTFGERLADKVADFGGSWTFIITFALIIFGWIALNSFILYKQAFDPYPYILLNLMLSCLAALQAPVIMMSQNRQETKDRQRAQNDYLVNLKAEIEVRTLNEKLEAMSQLLEEMKQQQQALMDRL
ncbi:DUF1003 domain-containing protein [Arsenicibacter rosenii]|uniref:Cyclic nucleotide-binding protein n=1 Tax=Arsenicibacter rosenii TaxID=1750698 RepID=A0A1S2VQZ5_9BACT|nr:DUF1003 domain-containing protein [Arsenicibacter rosenii]OIN60635.1 hypothetical protein BLX24_00505 [Arsenicibacter rosenii]